MNKITPNSHIDLPITAFIATMVSVVWGAVYYIGVLNENNIAHASYESRIEVVEIEHHDLDAIIERVRVELKTEINAN